MPARAAVMTAGPWGPWNAWSWYWLAWFVLTFPVTFLGPELYALWSGHSENTLSAQIWRLEGFIPGQSIWAWSFAHVLIGGIIGTLLVWLLGHFVLGIWH
jgi:hypothetical protein